MLNHEYPGEEPLPEDENGEDNLKALFSESFGLSALHILCGFLIILLDIAALGTSMQALLTSLQPYSEGGGVVTMGLTYLGFGPFISQFSPLHVVLAMLVAISFLEVSARLIQNQLGMHIKARIVQKGPRVHSAESIPTKERAMAQAERLLKALEFSFFCIVVIVALFFLSPALSLTLAVAGALLVGLTVLSQRGRARKRNELAIIRREYTTALRSSNREPEELDRLRISYFNESLALKRIIAGITVTLGGLQAAVLIVVVVAISYMQFPPAIIAVPIIIVLSVRRFVSNGRSAGAKLASMLEKRGFWSMSSRNSTGSSDVDREN